jgi:ABC-type glycerol-3-phosphate transport system substrate-binding protein
MKLKLVKMISLCTVAMLTLSLMAGCNSSAKNSAIKIHTLTGMCWGTTAGVTLLDQGVRAAIPGFNSKFNPIKWVIGGDGDADVAQKIRLALSANTKICDFAMLNYSEIPEFAQAGALTDLANTMKPYANELLPGVAVLSSYKGKTVAIPYQAKPRLWFYRSDMFAKAGIDPATVKTTDDFIAAGKKLQAVYPKSFIWNFGSAMPEYDFNLCLSGNGAHYTNAEGNFVINSDPNIRNMLTEYKKIHDSGVVSDISDFTTDWNKAFADSVLPSSLCASWLDNPQFLPTYAGSSQTGKWAVAQWPNFANSVGGSDAGGSVFVVPTFSSDPAGAEEWLSEALMSKEGSLSVFKSTKAFPINKNAASDPAVQVPDAFFGSTLVPALIQATSNLKVFPYDPNASQELTIIIPYFIKAVNGNMSIDDALKDAQNDCVNQISNVSTKK